MRCTCCAITCTGESLSSTTTIEELGAERGQTISLVVQLIAPPTPSSGVAPTHQPQSSEAPPTLSGDVYHMPDAFTVHIEVEGGESREVLVKVEKTAVSKPFLGGFRHRTTGIEYHHASAQTMPKLRPDNGVS